MEKNGERKEKEKEKERKIEDGVLLVVPVRVNGQLCQGLVDSGATRSFISIGTVTKYQMECQAEDTFLELGNGEKILSKGKVKDAHVVTGGVSGKFDLTVTKLLHQVDVVLGLNWLQTINPVIDWKSSKLYFPASVGTSMLIGQWVNDVAIQTVKILLVGEELEVLKNKDIQKQIAVIRTPTFWDYKTARKEWRQVKAVQVQMNVRETGEIQCIL